MSIYRKTQRLSLRLYHELVRVDYTHQAASLAFATVLSTIPIILISFTILSYLPIFDQIAGKIERLILNNFLGPTASTIDQNLDLFLSHAQELPSMSIVFLFITNTFLFFNIEGVLNKVWRVTKGRHTLRGFFTYVAVLLLFPITLATGFLLHSYLNVIDLYPSLSLVSESINLITHYMPVILTFFTFFMMYKLIPNCPIAFRHAVYASLFSSLLFEFSKILFGFYITNLANFHIIYGTLAALPVYMLWIYITWLILLLGAVLSYTISHPSPVASNTNLTNQE